MQSQSVMSVLSDERGVSILENTRRILSEISMMHIRVSIVRSSQFAVRNLSRGIHFQREQPKILTIQPSNPLSPSKKRKKEMRQRQVE